MKLEISNNSWEIVDLISFSSVSACYFVMNMLEFFKMYSLENFSKF